ncbi:hypothetical protein K7X08_018534 [Anisodus acutangulus]|uniref:Uncharacterized protein n=1 Tax=Anisodus acutangulus TaxID=402998 RepID=A0A9Q1LXW0_9SOLA|nr:hypothetical protein K7X08_018534 [Anisodus acutangulus]
MPLSNLILLQRAHVQAAASPNSSPLQSATPPTHVTVQPNTTTNPTPVLDVAEFSHARSAPDVAESDKTKVKKRMLLLQLEEEGVDQRVQHKRIFGMGCCAHKLDKLLLILDCQVKCLEIFNIQQWSLEIVGINQAEV